MKIKDYNQKLSDSTKYACTIYTFLNILRNDFKVVLRNDIIISFTYYLEKIWVFLRLSWAVFAIIYPAMVKYINIRYWINLKIKTSTISDWLSETNTWWLWLKKLTTKGQKLWTIDWIFTREDVDLAINYPNWYWHNQAWFKWETIDSYGWVRYLIWLPTLKYWVVKDLYYNTWRTVIAWDSFTERLQKQLIEKYRFTWREATLEEFTYILKELKKT